MKKGNIVLFFPSYVGMGTYHWFPFPYLYIGPFLEKAGFKSVIIDARIEPQWKELLRKSLNGSLCVGITAMTGSDIKDAIEAATICKKADPMMPVIWGGPHATADPEGTARLDYVDAAVCGQGEDAMTKIAERVYEGKDFSGIPGVVYKKGESILKNTKSEVPFDYDIYPGFHLVDVEKYRSPNNIISVFTSRGCPFRCSFCTTGDKDYSERTLEQVKNEISFVVDKLKFKNIFFQDGTFFVKKKRVMKIAEWLVSSDINIKWKGKARTNSLLDYSAEELALLKKSGLVSVFFGVESGSQSILDRMQKGTKPEDAEKSAAICRDYGMEFYASFMFAVPHETTKDLQNTIAHIRKLKKINPKAIIQNCIYIPLPDTPMYEDARRCGYKPPETLEGWIERNISSRFEERHDITWIPPKTLKEYIKIYNREFGVYKHLFEREKEGAYTSVFKEKTEG
ncbi:MAG: radical SAM protein [Candidatus Omnitrophota bacterium]